MTGRLPSTGGTPGRNTTRQAATALAWLALDAVAWPVGLTVAVWSRYGFGLGRTALAGALLMSFLGTLVQAIAAQVLRVHHGHHRYGTLEDARAVGITVLTTAVFLCTVDVVGTPRLVPASCTLTGGVLALLVMLGARYRHRRRYDRSIRPHDSAEAVLVFGAGETAHTLIRTMLRDRHSRYRPVGLVDDDRGKRYLNVHGVPILGARQDIPRVLARTGASAVIFAVAHADAELIHDIQDLTLGAGAKFKVIPSISELLDGDATITDVRDLRPSDLLGRRQVDTDVDPIAGYLTGKRVLVTGAGGSIGSELCRQLHRYGPSELMMLDRDESALHAVQLSLHGRALLDDPELILADLRDEHAMRTVFAERDPQVVFHAAALKHLSLLQSHPAEAVKTNVLGTRTLLDLCSRVERFVNISTDKAANPISVLGYSKRITERLTAHAAGRYPGTFLSVRFGNVLGSRGSVLTAFSEQAAVGGPITVTHPEVTRYFMTVQEAVQLVIQAAALGHGGEILVLDMGKPVRIMDIAEQLARQAPRRVEIVHTGLRPGEKLHEELFGDGENGTRSRHPLISHVDAPPLAPEQLHGLDVHAPADQIVAALARTTATLADAASPGETRSPGEAAGVGEAASGPVTQRAATP